MRRMTTLIMGKTTIRKRGKMVIININKINKIKTTTTPIRGGQQMATGNSKRSMNTTMNNMAKVSDDQL